MPRLDRLPEANRSNLLNLPGSVNDGGALREADRPLAACRLAIVTTAGLHRRGDRPFGPGEQGLSHHRERPADGRDHPEPHQPRLRPRRPSARRQHLFPIDRLRELVARGELGRTGGQPTIVHGRAARLGADPGRDRSRGGPPSAGARAWTPRSSPPPDPSARTPAVCWRGRSKHEGIATTSISMVREHTEKLKPPRALFVPLPFGHALGRAQRRGPAAPCAARRARSAGRARGARCSAISPTTPTPATDPPLRCRPPPSSQPRT